jgi:hypothetical protein
MAFVNELVSEEEIRQYGLDELMKEFRPFAWRDGRPTTFEHAWTIDRSRGIFFIPVKTIEEVGQSGRPQPTRKKICILNWKGRRAQLTIDRAAGSSISYSDAPFRIVWDLVDLDTTQLPDVPREEMIQTIKDALRAYGDFGAYRDVPNTEVSFEF